MKVITRERAKARSLKRYYTGIPCKRGHLSERGTHTGNCLACMNWLMAKWRIANPVAARAIGRRCDEKTRKISRTRVKLDILERLGKSKCACCKELEIAFLCVDHRNGGGTKHRAEVGASYKLYYWLKHEIKRIGIQAVRKKFRILCANCNMAHGMLGYCPHRK